MTSCSDSEINIVSYMWKICTDMNKSSLELPYIYESLMVLDNFLKLENP